MEITKEKIEFWLSYDEESGNFRWKKMPVEAFTETEKFSLESLANRWNGRFAGKIAGNKNKGNGYVVIKVFGKKLRAHRLAWLIKTGKWPEFIDHKNGIRDDNRWENLREVTKQENNLNAGIAKNNSSGRVGVYFHKRDKRWYAAIQFNGKKMFKSFELFEDAVIYREELEKLYGFYENNRRS